MTSFAVAARLDDRRKWWPNADENEYYGEDEPHLECETPDGKDFSIPFGAVLDRVRARFPVIAMDQETVTGSPRISGTRIPLYMILRAIRHFGTVEGAAVEYDLTAAAVKDALAFAAAVLEEPVEQED